MHLLGKTDMHVLKSAFPKFFQQPSMPWLDYIAAESIHFFFISFFFVRQHEKHKKLTFFSEEKAVAEHP